ncbi:MAG: AAA family ATPase, partial [Smithella sp.]
PQHLFFDEIQNLPRWELFVNRLQRQGFKMLITGSNANLLSSELSTHLTGRHAAVALFPFSFREYLTISENQKTTTEKKDALDAYMEQGGYPEPLLKKIDRRDYLRSLLQSTLYKDIIKRFKIRSAQGIEDLTFYLIWKSSNNEEVDFVVKEGLHVSRLIQVCSDISNPQTMKREMRALVNASQELNCNDLLLLNDRVDSMETFKWQDAQRKIRLMPLWQWLEEEK